MATLANNLPGLTKEIRDRASKAVRKAAFDLSANAKKMAPVDTGLLRLSIATHVIDDLNVIVGTAVDYAIYLEYGTHKMPPHPFMTPAAALVRPAFEKALGQLGIGGGITLADNLGSIPSPS